MTLPSADIKDLLVTAGVGTFALGTSTDWSINISQEPPFPTVPHTAITIYDTGGFAPNARFLLEEPTVQVRIRGNPNDYQAAYLKAQAVKDALLGRPGSTLNGNKYVGIWQDSDIISLGNDDNDRPILVANFKIVREPPASTSSHRQVL